MEIILTVSGLDEATKFITEIRKSIPEEGREMIEETGNKVKDYYTQNFRAGSKIREATYGHFISEDEFEVGVSDRVTYPVHPKGSWRPRTAAEVAGYLEEGVRPAMTWGKMGVGGGAIRTRLGKWMPMSREDTNIFTKERIAIPGKHYMARAIEQVETELPRIVDDFIKEILDKAKEKSKIERPKKKKIRFKGKMPAFKKRMPAFGKKMPGFKGRMPKFKKKIPKF